MTMDTSSEAAATFIKNYSHEHFIHPSQTVCQPAYKNLVISEKIRPLLGDLNFDSKFESATERRPSSRRSSGSSSLFIDSIEEEAVESHSDTDDTDDGGNKVPELMRPPYQQLSRSPKRSMMYDIDDRAQAYLMGRGSRRRASAPVTLMTMANLNESDDEKTPSIIPPASKEEDDVPETPAYVIESMKREAAILSQIKMKQMKRLDIRRGSTPVISYNTGKSAKPITSERVHHLMQRFIGPQPKPTQVTHVGVHDPTIQAERRISQADTSVQVSSRFENTVTKIPAPPPPPDILLSASVSGEPVPEVKPPPAKVEEKVPVKPLTELVADLTPTIVVPASPDLRRSSATQDLEETFKKLGPSEDKPQVASQDGTTTWFGGLIGLRPAPSRGKPSDPTTPVIRRKVKKKDLNVFAPSTL